MTLDDFRADNISNLFIVGTFAKKVTVLHQQTRALNLIHQLVEGGYLDKANTRIAIVGAGFTGLTAAAGILRKAPNCDLTIFERRDTLMPLQQGSDARWLHPRIYDWPDHGSESKSAMLPLMNWTAGRASDVAVQLSTAWRKLVAERKTDSKLRLFCNTRHLKVVVDEATKKAEKIEWVGEKREAANGATDSNASPEGSGEFEPFDVVLLCVGFGLEDEATQSYWRNETLAQPSLTPGRQMVLISGAGDGAIVDLLRARISNFRQDRILSEVFSDDTLTKELVELKAKYNGEEHTNLFFELDELLQAPELNTKFLDAINELRRRLRRDSGAILNTRSDSISKIFKDFEKRVSFQNAVLLFMLYKAGGFIPTCECYRDVQKRYNIPDELVIVRHGTKREALVSQILADHGSEQVRNALGDISKQSGDRIGWQGGYFGFPGKWEQRSELDGDELRRSWRKEYLPDATQIACATLCSAVAGSIRKRFPSTEFRLTFHRSMLLYEEPLLQQCCEYVMKDQVSSGTAGRTFTASSASIGLAYRLEKVIRTKQNVSHSELYDLMDKLSLNEAARAMRGSVRHLACLPILQSPDSYVGDSRVAGILYIDSDNPDAHFDDEFLKLVAAMLEDFGQMVSRSVGDLSEVRNVPLTTRQLNPSNKKADEIDFSGVFDLCSAIDPPIVDAAMQINLDETSFKNAG
jgi:NAD(P)-binding Rossmann-like domain